MIPAELRPHWWNLPALAWLAAGRFTAPALRRPGLQLAAQAAGWPVMLQVLLGAHAEHTVAAWRGRALVIVNRRAPAGGGRTWRAWSIALAGVPVTVAALLAPGLLLEVLGLSLGRPGDPATDALTTTALAAVLLQVLLAVAQVLPAARDGILRRRSRAHTWTARRYPHLAEATTLAAHPEDRRAATVLVRALRQIADREQVTVLAQARDPHVAELYQRLGFQAVPDVDGALYRAPTPPADKQHTAT